MRSLLIGLWVIALLTASMTISASGQSKRALTTRNKAKARQHARQDRACSRCTVQQVAVRNNSRALKKSAKPATCHPKGYVNPAIARNYNGAMRDLRRAGIDPKVTSTWRSSADQARLHRCSNSRHCRRAHPSLYYALPPGASLHEAGFAVDMSGIAIGPRGSKRLTTRGRRVIAIMRKHGFSWRYGLADPAHFEIAPQKHGYRSTQQAIKRSQTQCQTRYLARRDQGSPAKRKESVSRRIVARNR
jgi:LAS superfamily LD-carboxypeptidase LdcB